MHYLLFYEVGEDYVSRRAEFRDAHLEKAWAASARGELVLGGALANPVDGAVLLFKGDSPEVAEKFAHADPYVTSGAVKRWHVREWTTVARRRRCKTYPATRGNRSKSHAKRVFERLEPRFFIPRQGDDLANVEGALDRREVGPIYSARHREEFSRRFELSKDIAEHICSAAQWTAWLNLWCSRFGSRWRRSVSSPE